MQPYATTEAICPPELKKMASNSSNQKVEEDELLPLKDSLLHQ
jgi:hypothetical protein